MMKDSLFLGHNKYIAYLQILAGFVIALIAAQAFNLFEINSNFIWGSIVVNNFVVGFLTGCIGLYFFRRNLKEIENRVWSVR